MRMNLALAVCFVCVAGCTAGVTRPNNESKTVVARVAGPTTVAVTFSESGKKAAGENLKFDQNKLKDVLDRGLDAKGLLAKGGHSPAQFVDVEITDVRVRGTFSAVMFGFMAGNDHINGKVTLSDGEHHPLRHFDVSAAYALGGIAGGQDDTRMSWLYEKFSEETLNELTNDTASASSKVAKQ